MKILVSSSPTSLARDHGTHPNLGVLSSPRRFYTNVDGWEWAADNDAYSAWDAGRFRAMLDAITGTPGCLFVAAPDVVGEHSATLTRFDCWYWELRHTGQPVAFVAQDGLTVPPWEHLDVLFIGGTTAYKLSAQVARLCVEARERGVPIHMGRVNSRHRIRYAKWLGCSTVDGSGYSRYRHTHLPAALAAAASPSSIYEPQRFPLIGV